MHYAPLVVAAALLGWAGWALWDAHKRVPVLNEIKHHRDWEPLQRKVELLQRSAYFCVPLGLAAAGYGIYHLNV